MGNKDDRINKQTKKIYNKDDRIKIYICIFQCTLIKILSSEEFL